MALKTNIVSKKKNTALKKILKIATAFVLFIAIIVIGGILYFNNQNIKTPLLKYLSEKTSLNINCDKIEFSPLYPNVLKLGGVTIDGIKVSEVYVEYSLEDLFDNKDLDIKYLYCKGITFKEQDLSNLKQEQIPFEAIKIGKLDLIDTPLWFNNFKAQHATFSAQNFLLMGNISFENGSLSADTAQFENLELKKLNTKIDLEKEAIRTNQFNAQVLGGQIQADLKIDPAKREITFNSLTLNKIILKDLTHDLPKYTISAGISNLYDCVVILPQSKVILGQITGQVKDLFLDKNQINYNFEGKIDEISIPSLQITAEHNEVNATALMDSLQLSLKGKVFQGEFNLNSNYTKNLKDYYLNIDNFTLKDAKLEPTTQLVDYLTTKAFEHNTYIKSLNLDNCEFVSNIDAFPITIKAVKLNSHNYSFDKDSHLLVGNEAQSTLDLDSLYIKDLFIKRATVHSKLHDKIFSVNSDLIEFSKGNNLSFSYTYDDKLKEAHFNANAKDFNLENLNSSFFNHLFNGKVDFSTDLAFYAQDSSHETFDNVPSPEEQEQIVTESNLLKEDIPSFAKPCYGYNLVNTNQFYLKSATTEGELSLSSDSLFISDIGLDLVNGGPKKDYVLNFEDFLFAIKGSDLGLYKLDLEASIDDNIVKAKLSSDLTSSHISSRASYDLLSKELSSRTTFVSLPKDSLSTLKIEGPIKDLKVIINAITRGEMRSGINTDHLQGTNGKETSLEESNATPPAPKETILEQADLKAE